MLKHFQPCGVLTGHQNAPYKNALDGTSLCLFLAPSILQIARYGVPVICRLRQKCHHFSQQVHIMASMPSEHGLKNNLKSRLLTCCLFV
jgi:hypothetical protein